MSFQQWRAEFRRLIKAAGMSPLGFRGFEASDYQDGMTPAEAARDCIRGHGPKLGTGLVGAMRIADALEGCHRLDASGGIQFDAERFVAAVS